MPQKKPRLIGLTGTNGAGKGEVAAFFKRKGYAYFSLSDLIREELIRKGKGATRDNLITAGNVLRKRYGADILARRAMKKVEKNAVIDSIRNAKEVEFLRNHGDFLLIAVDAPVEIRYNRVRQRGRDESASSLQEFIKKENQEMSGSENGQQLSLCMSVADLLIINDGSLESLHKKLEDLL